MKRAIGLIMILALLIALTACASEGPASEGASAVQSYSSAVEEEQQGADEQANEGQQGDDKEKQAMKLKIGDREVPVSWEENDSVDELFGLAESTPLKIQMSMYGGFEQVGPIGQSITSRDEQTTTQAGDIVLYSGDQIVIFYGSNSWDYTRLGHVDLSADEMEELLGNGDVVVTIGQ